MFYFWLVWSTTLHLLYLDQLKTDFQQNVIIKPSVHEFFREGFEGFTNVFVFRLLLLLALHLFCDGLSHNVAAVLPQNG